MNRRLSIGILAVLLAGSVPVVASMTTAGAEEPTIGVVPAAPVLRIVDGANHQIVQDDAKLCEGTKISMDSPVRAFEDQNDVIHMTIATPNAHGHQWTGPEGEHSRNETKLHCDSVLRGDLLNAYHSQFDQKTFLQALHFDRSTNTVYGYGHQDNFATRIPKPDCYNTRPTPEVPGDPAHKCWYSSVNYWQSPILAEEKLSFTHVRGQHVAIYPHQHYPGNAQTPSSGWIGYGTPSNIVRGRDPETGRLDGYSYMFVYTSANEPATGTTSFRGQEWGACLFRNADPSVRTGWRAYDADTGEFTQEMRNPYPDNSVNQPCDRISAETLPRQPLRSVVWHAPSRHYLAILRSSTHVQFATSRDLITWSEPQDFMPALACEANYPTIIDLAGGDYGDANFDRLYGRDRRSPGPIDPYPENDAFEAVTDANNDVVSGTTWLYYRKKTSCENAGLGTKVARRLIEIDNYGPDFPGPN